MPGWEREGINPSPTLDPLNPVLGYSCTKARFTLGMDLAFRLLDRGPNGESENNGSVFERLSGLF